jgi:hypothetical protein
MPPAEAAKLRRHGEHETVDDVMMTVRFVVCLDLEFERTNTFVVLRNYISLNQYNSSASLRVQVQYCRNSNKRRRRGVEERSSVQVQPPRKGGGLGGGEEGVGKVGRPYRPPRYYRHEGPKVRSTLEI